MKELVIVIADLHLPPELESGEPGAAPAEACGSWPGIEHVARFAPSGPLAGGWRGWVARWLDLAQYAHYPAASVAAATVEVPAGRACWLATPMHLIEGLTRVHVDWGCLLRLPQEQRERLAGDFKETFRGSGFDLTALESGEFLLTAPPLEPIRTVEPVRVLQGPMADALPSGEGAAPLRRLGTEIEMWLYAHPLNRERARRGERPVSTLWVWGGGEPPAPAAPRAHLPRPDQYPSAGELHCAGRSRAHLPRPDQYPSAGELHCAGRSRASAVTVFATEAYVRGLCRLAGLECGSAAPQVSSMDGTRTPRTLHVLQVAELLQVPSGMSFPAALAELDRRVVAPAVAVLRRGGIDRLVLVANDRRWTLRSADRLRFWRRRRAGLRALA